MGNIVITTTPFMSIYDSFLGKVTSDMYMEYSELDTLEMLQELLLSAIYKFELPKFDIYDYEEGCLEYLGMYAGVESEFETPATGWVGGVFNSVLTGEEINIISNLMVVEWVSQQLAVTELTRMKITGSDFKLTSQAAHMDKLIKLKQMYERDCFDLQRLYKRRRREGGRVLSTLGQIMEVPSYGYKI